MQSRVSVLIADDHPVVRMGVRMMLEPDIRFHVVAEAADGAEVLRSVAQFCPELLLLDIAMPKLTGLEVLASLAAHQSAVKVVMLSGTLDARQVMESFQLGARGVLNKNALTTELRQCLLAVLAGGYWARGVRVDNLPALLSELRQQCNQPPKTFGLTPRELQITGLVAEGCSNKDVAVEFKISEETVKHHLKKIFDKTGVNNRVELAIFAMNHSLTTR